MERGQASGFGFVPRTAAGAGSTATSGVAARVQDRAALVSEQRAVQAIAASFQKAVQGRHLYAAPEGATRFVDHMLQALQAYLAEHPFLMLHVSPDGFRFRGALLPGDERRDLPALLASEGIAEVWFRRGVTATEVTTLIETLEKAQPTHAGDATLATLWWEADLTHIRCVCLDELPGETARLVAVNEPVPAEEQTAEITAWIRLLGSAPTATPLPAAGNATLTTSQFPREDAVLARLGQLAIEVQAGETDVNCRGEALVLLGDLVDAAIAQRRAIAAQAIVAELRARAAATPGLNTVLSHVEEGLCREPNVMALGRVLDDDAAAPAEAAAARALLGSLQGAIGPLCTLLGRLENMQARKLVCHVLATVASDAPAALVQQASGQPWFVARNVAYVLGRIGTSAVVPFLRRWATHEEARVRLEVARALGRVHHASAGTLLCEMLQDGESRVRQSAVWSLAALDDVTVLPRLRALLFEDNSFRTRPADERDDFFRTYGRIADATAFDELARLLDRRTLMSVGWQNELRRGAALALGETGKPQAARLLQEHTGARDARLREACTTALQSLRARGREAAQSDDDTWHPARKDDHVPQFTGFRVEVDDAF